MQRTKPPFRADEVGSLLRPAKIKEARARLEKGEIGKGDLEQAIDLMSRHKAIADTIERARHYGKIARDAMAIFPESAHKSALLDVVAFCINRAH